MPITGMNYEVSPGQAEFQVCDIGIKAAHWLIILRYILKKVGEKYNYYIEFHPKPLTMKWNGSGCHVNYSIKKMRKTKQCEFKKIVEEMMKKLEKSHEHDLKLFGYDNEKRLTGKCETSNLKRFTYGVSDRSASIRLPKMDKYCKRRYFEDRRPGSNMDPYLVTSNLYGITCLNKKSLYRDKKIQEKICRYKKIYEQNFR